MKILMLEDDKIKTALIKEEIEKHIEHPDLVIVSTFFDFYKMWFSTQFDLFITDLIVPQYKISDEPIDLCVQIMDAARDYDSRNVHIPIIALTRYDQTLTEYIEKFNRINITVVTFADENEEWKQSLKQKLNDCFRPPNYDFIIICALQKETEGFTEAGYIVGPLRTILGLNCREIKIGKFNGVIVTCPRSGLVSSAITSTQAIHLFKPKLICMSGICAGIGAEIYDVIIPSMCYQHDSGKWTENGFIPETYPVQMNAEVQREIETFINDPSFKKNVLATIKHTEEELQKGASSLDFNLTVSVTSSGSSVIADKDMNTTITDQHRKLTAFEMESFSVYESARQSILTPIFFSAKCVVDKGTPIKNDIYQRVASIISAKVVYEIINRGIINN